MEVDDKAVGRDGARVDAHRGALDVRLRDVPDVGQDGLARLGT